MQQIPFAFGNGAAPRLEHFLGTENAELVSVLKTRRERFVYVWGRPGCGKSHLLQAWVQAASDAGHSALYIAAGALPEPEQLDAYEFLAVDDIGNRNEQDQITLFSVFAHRQNSRNGFLLCAGEVPPPQLKIREDLRTRMGFGLVYEVKSLSDEDKIAALVQMSQERQMVVEADIFRYLIGHWQRDWDALVGLLQALDTYSLQHKRRITLPLVKQFLQESGNLSASPPATR